jgi:dihydrofolate synthase/folylpolyglutamate synthase
VTNNPYLDQLFAAPSHQSSRTTPGSTPRGLSYSYALAQAFDFPHHSYPCIHVAGSNGKGSVSLKIAAALEKEGYKVGLYTSPHLIHFNERIRVNAGPIDEKSLNEGLKALFLAERAINLQATFFELATHLAFLHFRSQKVDVAVIETGLGGRLDATNIIDPILTVITSISLEHAYLLGNNLEAIALEKAGIIKQAVPCVIGPNARNLSIKGRADQLKAPLIPTECASPFFDDENCAIARNALMQLKDRFHLQDESIEAGLKVRPRCRFEQHGNVIFDVAHNPDAFAHLVQALERFFPQQKKRFLVGFCKDKDAAACLKHLLPAATHLHLVKAPTSRAASLEDLAHCLQQQGCTAYSCHPQIADAMEEALRLAKQAGELLIVCGSFYIMKEALEPIVN